ncbi:MAG: neutral/alkaline non-lysosomal ceramidase N-terminal domain-containing protein [Verrucomicrobia bacterium]|nr:neutral/alkaline non-lysosomal ceramidase N-terminal domain-containing protein [Verrucomicrobiota bacterium]
MEVKPEVRSRPRRRWLKWSVRVVVVGVGLIIVGVVCSVKPVDHTPYFTTHYYESTRSKFTEQARGYQLARGPLRAGFGRAKLSPSVGAQQDAPEQGKFRSVPLAGYGDRSGRPAEGTHDDLWAKAVALEVGTQRVVIVSADALIMPREIAEAATTQLKSKYSLRREQIYFSATHTHCGPGGWGEGVVSEAFVGGFQPGVRTWFAQQIVAAVDEAMTNLSTATIGSGRFNAPGFVHNRLVGDKGRVDDEFVFTVIRNANGGSAVMGVFGAHATVLSGRVMQFSADYPGYWQRKVEEQTHGLAMFLAGGVGSHGPDAKGGGFEGAQRMGEALAEEVLKRLTDVKVFPDTSLGIFGLELQLPEAQVRLTDGWRLRPAITRRLMPVSDHTFIQTVRLGDTLWFSTPCDFSGELALDLKGMMERHGLHAVVTSFNGDYIGYVVPLQYYHYPGYEPRLMSFYGPYVSVYLMDWMRRMAGVASDERPAAVASSKE